MIHVMPCGCELRYVQPVTTGPHADGTFVDRITPCSKHGEDDIGKIIDQFLNTQVAARNVGCQVCNTAIGEDRFTVMSDGFIHSACESQL